jgi:hypothetical protein
MRVIKELLKQLRIFVASEIGNLSYPWICASTHKIILLEELAERIFKFTKYEGRRSPTPSVWGDPGRQIKKTGAKRKSLDWSATLPPSEPAPMSFNR